MTFFLILYSRLLRLRYHVTVKGLDQIGFPKNNAFFLSNHPALMDPQLFFSTVGRSIPISPIIIDTYYRMPLLRWAIKRYRPVVIPDFGKRREIDTFLRTEEETLQALKQGRNIVIYPAGELSRTGKERIHNKRMPQQIVSALPEKTQVIGVRVSGLWGSSWSKANTAKTPRFAAQLFRGAFVLLFNLFWLTPKRKVLIELEDITQQAREEAKKGRADFNKYLEAFYNTEAVQRCCKRKYFFFLPQIQKQVSAPEKEEQPDTQQKLPRIPSAVQKLVINLLAKELEISKEKISLTSHLGDELHIDSLSLARVVERMEKKFPSMVVPTLDEKIKYVSDLCLIAIGFGNEEQNLPDAASFHRWRLAPGPLRVPEKAEHIVWEFIKTFSSSRRAPFAYDAFLGVSHRKTFLLKAIVVSRWIKKNIKGDTYVGIMLPSMQSTTLLIAATYLAGKIPIMFNWTVGKKMLSTCVDMMPATKIFTASKFHARIIDSIPEDVSKKLIFLDKEVSKIGLGIKLKSLFLSLKPRLFLRPKIHDTAVILFTSGSETLPKAVPLTHKNILADLQGALPITDFTDDMIFMGILPPFHSFGFSVLVALPLMSGVRIAYAPNPTDALNVIALMKQSKAQFLPLTPTFFDAILNMAEKEDLTHLTHVITGAEKLPQAVYKKAMEASNNHIAISEGYGITECSPIVSLSPFTNYRPQSVGQLLSNMEALVVHPETNAILPPQEAGMILVRGDNVFGGYFHQEKETKNPFVTIEGKTYYRTGDLGYFDANGFLFLTGRQKRFIKIAGEMVSLPLIEETLNQKYGRLSEEGIPLAVEGTDETVPHKIILFATFPITVEEANAYLRSQKLAHIIALTEVRQIDEIPLLGSGKINYRSLKERL